jgi:phthalate 4,5-cis-dihydrodiol dehydrogenase
MSERILRLGVAGLGRGFQAMLPALAHHPRVRVVAAADPRPEARERFMQDFGGRAFGKFEELCADPQIEAVYIATPHQFHADQVALAARHGKHVLVEKPLALTLTDADAIIAEVRRVGVVLVVGHSHGFDVPIARTRALVASDAFGRLGMISALYFTDFIYRPRRPEELDSARGGGVLFNQLPHHLEMIRLIGGGRVRSVRAQTGIWDAARPAEGAYSAFLTFENGVFATLTYSGYAHFDGDEFCGGFAENGQPKDSAQYGLARRRLGDIGVGQENSVKSAGLYGGSRYAAPSGLPPLSPSTRHPHFGLVIASCEKADLRPTPEGVMIYGDAERRLEMLPPPAVPRAEVLDELWDAVVNGTPPLHDGPWSLATLECCLAVRQSASENREVLLERQIATSDETPGAARAIRPSAPN